MPQNLLRADRPGWTEDQPGNVASVPQNLLRVDKPDYYKALFSSVIYETLKEMKEPLTGCTMSNTANVIFQSLDKKQLKVRLFDKEIKVIINNINVEGTSLTEKLLSSPTSLSALTIRI